ncbi:hypothetical protein KRMM14A1259_57850 [Krasilnikovia sp. MM14-A1259]
MHRASCDRVRGAGPGSADVAAIKLRVGWSERRADGRVSGAYGENLAQKSDPSESDLR